MNEGNEFYFFVSRSDRGRQSVNFVITRVSSVFYNTIYVNEKPTKKKIKEREREFYASRLKGPSGASSNRIVRLSVRLSVRP